MLDEASANLEPAFEAQLFGWCASSGTTTLTISHHAELRQHHTHELQLDGCGGSALKALHGSDDEQLVQRPSCLSEHTAPCARLVAPRAQVAPTSPLSVASAAWKLAVASGARRSVRSRWRLSTFNQQEEGGSASSGEVVGGEM